MNVSVCLFGGAFLMSVRGFPSYLLVCSCFFVCLFVLACLWVPFLLSQFVCLFVRAFCMPVCTCLFVGPLFMALFWWLIFTVPYKFYTIFWNSKIIMSKSE
jgi:hypothetical protein